MTQRTSVPSKLQRLVLVKNKHCCCICQKDGYGKEVIIHHIDGNNSNNIISNLAVLCLIHASMADASLIKGKLGSGKKLSPDEVKEFKRIWERKTEEEGKIQRAAPLPDYRKRQLETLYHFEIHSTKNKILSYKESDPRVEEGFEYFDQLVIEDFVSGLKIRKILLDAYSHMTYQSIQTNDLTKRLAKSLWGLFLHLVGPHYVKIMSEDKKLFKESVDNLKTLGEWAAEFSSKKSTLEEVCSIIHDFAEIATWYDLSTEKRRISRMLTEMLKSCDEFEKESNSQRNIKARQNRKAVIVKTKEKIKTLK